MSATGSPFQSVGRTIGFVGGLAVTAMSMSSGFIWASQEKAVLVYVAGFACWTGYLVAHLAVTGVFVDDVDGPEAGTGASEDENSSADSGEQAGSAGSSWSVRSALAQLRAIAPENPWRAAGFVAGIAVLVAGIAILAWYVRQGNHLLGNVGSGMFLLGYVVAHYFDTRTFL